MKNPSRFLTDLHLVEHPKFERVWFLDEPLGYYSDLLKQAIWAPVGFYTDLASVPRLPIIYTLWGDRSHREAVIHDLLYRRGAVPDVTQSQANHVFYEAMLVRDKPWWIRHPMFWGVSLGGSSSFKARGMDWRPE